MATLNQKARAHLEALEAERQAALALSEEKFEEAKLTKARQEGFYAALKMLNGETSVEPAERDHAKISRPRRGRPPIRQFILRELSLSSLPMTVAQLSRAIEYNREGIETALIRMGERGQVVRDPGGRWSIASTGPALVNDYAVCSDDRSSEELISSE